MGTEVRDMTEEEAGEVHWGRGKVRMFFLEVLTFQLAEKESET